MKNKEKYDLTKTEEQRRKVIKIYDCSDEENKILIDTVDRGAGVPRNQIFAKWAEKEYKEPEKPELKFKVGDKVRVRSWKSMAKEFGLDQCDNIDCSARFIHSMKKYCGTIQTIGSVDSDRYYLVQKNSEDIHCWVFTDDMLEPVKEPTKGEHFRKELKALKGYTVAVKNNKPERCIGACWNCLLHRSIPCQNEFKKWCEEPYEAQEDKPLLDKVEHDYLASVVAPKRIYDNVKYIKKIKFDHDKIYILVKLCASNLYLPNFKPSDHMYDGMKPNQPYTLAELGLKVKQ